MFDRKLLQKLKRKTLDKIKYKNNPNNTAVKRIRYEKICHYIFSLGTVYVRVRSHTLG